jgi:hypothetical protein
VAGRISLLEALGNMGDFVGGIAVIATLVYLAIQVRQNTRLLGANTLAAASSAMLSFNHLLGSDPAAARVFQVGLEDFRSLPEDERRQFLNLLRAAFTAHEHLFGQYEQGLVEEHVWQKNRQIAQNLLDLPHVQIWWKHRKSIFTDSFARALDQAPPLSRTTLAGDVIAEMIAGVGSKQ